MAIAVTSDAGGVTSWSQTVAPGDNYLIVFFWGQYATSTTVNAEPITAITYAGIPMSIQTNTARTNGGIRIGGVTYPITLAVGFGVAILPCPPVGTANVVITPKLGRTITGHSYAMQNVGGRLGFAGFDPPAVNGQWTTYHREDPYPFYPYPAIKRTLNVPNGCDGLVANYNRFGFWLYMASDGHSGIASAETTLISGSNMLLASAYPMNPIPPYPGFGTTYYELGILTINEGSINSGACGAVRIALYEGNACPDEPAVLHGAMDWSSTSHFVIMAEGGNVRKGRMVWKSTSHLTISAHTLANATELRYPFVSMAG